MSFAFNLPNKRATLIAVALFFQNILSGDLYISRLILKYFKYRKQMLLVYLLQNNTIQQVHFLVNV